MHFLLSRIRAVFYMISLSARTVSLTRIIHATSCFFLSRFIFFLSVTLTRKPLDPHFF